MTHPGNTSESSSDSRALVLGILRENFRLYIGCYLLAFVLMGLYAAATGASVFLMLDSLRIVFTTPVKIQPITAAADQLPYVDLPRINDLLYLVFQSLKPGMAKVISVAAAILAVFAVKRLANYGSSVILSKVGNAIAHRFSTIRNALIIRLRQDGRLVSSGSHEELLRDADCLST